MLLNEWASLVLICVLGAFSPGPSLMVILSLTTSNGRKAGYIASIGHGTGIFIYALLSATGLAMVVNSNPEVFVSVQILGAIFLFYLGFRIIRSSLSKDLDNSLQLVAENFFSNRFFDGFLIAILNPKILAFFLSLFSQFLTTGQTFTIRLGMATLAGTIDTFAYLTMVSLVSTNIMLKFLSKYKKSVEFTFGLLLIVFSVSLGFKIMLAYL